MEARIATEGVIKNDNSSLLETQTDDATLTTLLAPTEKDLDPTVDSSAITASPCCMQAPEESSVCIVERVEAAPYSIPVGRERVCVPCSGRFLTLSSLWVHERFENPELFVQEHENYPAALTLETQLEEMAEYEIKHGSNGRIRSSSGEVSRRIR